MSRYIQRKPDSMNKVYIIWERYPSTSGTFPNLERPKKMIDIHKTMDGAMLAESLLVRSQNSYHIIEIRELKE